MIESEMISEVARVAVEEDGCHPYPLNPEDYEAVRSFIEENQDDIPGLTGTVDEALDDLTELLLEQNPLNR